MGTCIGLRNIRYFVSFLFFTALHALVTTIISLAFFSKNTIPVFDQVFDREDRTQQQQKNTEPENDQDDKTTVSEFM